MRTRNRYIHAVLPILALLLFSTLPTRAEGTQAKEWSADDIPAVHLKDKYQYVSDPENILSQQARDSANLYLAKLEHEFGVQSAFIIVGNVPNADVFRVAQDFGNRYGVGSKKTRRGLVIVIAITQHKYFIAPGKGLEGELTDVECNDIAQACIVKNMRKDNPDNAVLATTKAIYNKLKTGNAGITDEDETADDNDTVWYIIIFILIFLFNPIIAIIRWILGLFGIKLPKSKRRGKGGDGFPPIFFGGGSRWSGGGSSSGGSYGGGSFGGGGSGGSW